MFAYCDECGYDSGDKPDMESLKKKIDDDGGQLSTGDDKGVTQCPRCKSYGTLGVD